MDWRAGPLKGGAQSPCCRAPHSRRASGTEKAEHWSTIHKIPRLMAAQEGERTQIMWILLSRGIWGINERTRGLTQRWFDIVDWRSVHVGSTRLGASRSIGSYTQKLEG